MDKIASSLEIIPFGGLLASANHMVKGNSKSVIKSGAAGLISAVLLIMGFPFLSCIGLASLVLVFVQVLNAIRDKHVQSRKKPRSIPQNTLTEESEPARQRLDEARTRPQESKQTQQAVASTQNTTQSVSTIKATPKIQSTQETVSTIGPTQQTITSTPQTPETPQIPKKTPQIPQTPQISKPASKIVSTPSTIYTPLPTLKVSPTACSLTESLFSSSAKKPNQEQKRQSPRKLNKKQGNIIKSRWGYTLTVNDQGEVMNGMSNQIRDGWQGWSLENCGEDQFYLSRSKDKGKLVLCIDGNGRVMTTQNRGQAQKFQLLKLPSGELRAFLKVSEPRMFLACTQKGNMEASKICTADGDQAWHIL